MGAPVAIPNTAGMSAPIRTGSSAITLPQPLLRQRYTEWDDNGLAIDEMSRSTDGGATWSVAATNITASLAVSRRSPDGTVIVPTANCE